MRGSSSAFYICLQTVVGFTSPHGAVGKENLTALCPVKLVHPHNSKLTGDCFPSLVHENLSLKPNIGVTRFYSTDLIKYNNIISNVTLYSFKEIFKTHFLFPSQPLPSLRLHMHTHTGMHKLIKLPQLDLGLTSKNFTF